MSEHTPERRITHYVGDDCVTKGHTESGQALDERDETISHLRRLHESDQTYIAKLIGEKAERDERIDMLREQMTEFMEENRQNVDRIARLEAAVREDAQHIHIIDHHRTKQRIDFEDCPSAFCSERRALLAEEHPR